MIKIQFYLYLFIILIKALLKASLFLWWCFLKCFEIMFKSKPSIVTVGVTGSYMPASGIPRYAIFYVFETTTQYNNKGTVITNEAVPIGSNQVAMYSCFKNNTFMWYSDKSNACQLNYDDSEYCYLAIFK